MAYVPFSSRHGHEASSPVRDDAPSGFRRAVYTALPIAPLSWDTIREIACQVLDVWPGSGAPWDEIEEIVKSCKWYKLFDIIEAVCSRLGRVSASAGQAFAREINEALQQKNLGWQLVSGQFVVRGDEAFEKSVGAAVSELNETRPTAANHIRSAVSALSARPKPNTSGAVAHATSSVECVLSDIKDETMTLGKYLDRFQNLFHPALRKSLDGIYGYASDTARHGKEGVEPTFEEAQFAVTVCAAACTLLSSTNPKTPTSDSSSAPAERTSGRSLNPKTG
jgi:hypothetical protein